MEEDSNLEKITDTIGDLVTGVPAPIRKNFFKAFGQLCTAAVDVPVAHLESKSKEIRAASEARVKILEREAQQISEKLQVPEEYVTKASEKFASKIVREQLNLDQIAAHAATNLNEKDFSEEEQTNEEEISDDWLNEFENFAKNKSSDDMKIIFGKILSGEIVKPGSFSIRTLRIISQLDNQAAKLFQTFCSQAVSLKAGAHLLDARVVSLNGNAASNSLTPYGLPFNSLNILHEYGLIISDYNSWMNYNPCIADENNKVRAILEIQGIQYGLVPTDKEKYDKILKLSGVALTKAGKELLKIIPFNDASKYRTALDEFLKNKHLEIVKLDNPQ
ncbi:DUF2806 domain-containing protein [Salegentibacter mishustinae]|uniref:DUF2806 domain-containing protein n=1 Tax=Salegentibacter mishustinae TaxID=270918 RepID=UPI0024917869|nr:DUF2806 domain-containing protein [Salegentibacter mishustinae]